MTLAKYVGNFDVGVGEQDNFHQGAGNDDSMTEMSLSGFYRMDSMSDTDSPSQSRREWI